MPKTVQLPIYSTISTYTVVFKVCWSFREFSSRGNTELNWKGQDMNEEAEESAFRLELLRRGNKKWAPQTNIRRLRSNREPKSRHRTATANKAPGSLCPTSQLPIYWLMSVSSYSSVFCRTYVSGKDITHNFHHFIMHQIQSPFDECLRTDEIDSPVDRMRLTIYQQSVGGCWKVQEECLHLISRTKFIVLSSKLTSAKWLIIVQLRIRISKNIQLLFPFFFFFPPRQPRQAQRFKCWSSLKNGWINRTVICRVGSTILITNGHLIATT